jgi:hypothetical protein
MTTDYLIDKYVLSQVNNALLTFLSILDRTDRPFLEVHNYIRDRARSIRQDFTIQVLFNEETLSIYERMARFRKLYNSITGFQSQSSLRLADIFSDHLLCEEDVSNFDPGQNIEQLDKVLISCREMCKYPRLLNH